MRIYSFFFFFLYFHQVLSLHFRIYLHKIKIYYVRKANIVMFYAILHENCFFILQKIIQFCVFLIFKSESIKKKYIFKYCKIECKYHRREVNSPGVEWSTYDKKNYWIHNFWVLKDNNIQGKMNNKTNIWKFSPFI